MRLYFSFPRFLSFRLKARCIAAFKSFLKVREVPSTCMVGYNKERKIKLILDSGETIYDIVERTIEGGDNDIAEDLRDYLRRRGIKFFIDRGFRSI